MVVGLARISVGAWRNFCSQAHRNATARFGGVARFGFFMKLSGGTKRANSVRPYRFIAVGGRVSVVFLFDFQASNKVQEVLFCAIRTSHRVHLTHALRMCPHNTATLQDIQFGIIPLYLSRKWGALLHKKCNNCRNVAKLKYKSFVCINLCR